MVVELLVKIALCSLLFKSSSYSIIQNLYNYTELYIQNFNFKGFHIYDIGSLMYVHLNRIGSTQILVV